MMRFTLRRISVRLTFRVCLAWACTATASALTQPSAPDPTTPPITAMAFAPEGDVLVCGSQRGLERRAWPSLESLGTIARVPPHIHDLSFIDEGQELMVAGGAPAVSGSVSFFSWPECSRTSVFERHEDLVLATASNPQTGIWVSGGHDARVLLYPPDENRPFELSGHSRPVTSAAFLPKSGLLVTGGRDNSIRVWDVAERRLLRTLDLHTRPVLDVAARPQVDDQPRDILVSLGEDRTIRFWQPEIGRLVRFARLERATPLAVAWLPDGESVLVACSDGRVRRLDLRRAAVVATYPALESWAYSLALHPDGEQLAVGGAGGQVVRITLPAEVDAEGAGEQRWP